MPRQSIQSGIMFSSREMICLKINIVLDVSSNNYTVLYAFKSRDDYLLFLSFLIFFFGRRGEANESHFPQIICLHSKLNKHKDHSMNVPQCGWLCQKCFYSKIMYSSSPPQACLGLKSFQRFQTLIYCAV